jgi:hypothetical protein
MNGGKIEITIAAVYGQFEQDMKKAATAASAGGRQAGQKFGEGFSAGSTTYIDRTINDIRGKLTKAVSAFTIVSAFSAALEEGAKGASIADSIAAGLKSIPVVGAFVTIGENLGKIIMRTAAKEAAAQETIEGQARLNQINQDRIDRQKKAQEEQARRAEEMARKVADINKNIEAQIDARDKARHEAKISRLERENQVFLVLQEERARKEAEIYEKMQKERVAARTADEEKAILDRYNAELALVRELDSRRVAELNKANDEERERNRTEQQQEAQRRARMIAEEEAKALEEINRLREQGVAAQSMVGTISTSFGTYKFAGYSDSEKKANDSAIRKAIEAVKENTRKLVDEIKRTGTAGGFV